MIEILSEELVGMDEQLQVYAILIYLFIVFPKKMTKFQHR